eukprot:454140-Pelagomonas_calceolata.AAC.2
MRPVLIDMRAALYFALAMPTASAAASRLGTAQAGTHPVLARAAGSCAPSPPAVAAAAVAVGSTSTSMALLPEASAGLLVCSCFVACAACCPSVGGGKAGERRPPLAATSALPASSMASRTLSDMVDKQHCDVEKGCDEEEKRSETRDSGTFVTYITISSTFQCSIIRRGAASRLLHIFRDDQSRSWTPSPLPNRTK